MDITITNKLTQLAAERNNYVVHEHIVESLRMELEDTEAWQEWNRNREFLKARKEIIESLEQEIRDFAVQSFDGQNKKPFKGIEIKEFSVIKVLDEKKALVWASQNAPSILKLDQTKFKKAVENLELDFVEKGVEYRTQIASDLSEYLK